MIQLQIHTVSWYLMYVDVISIEQDQFKRILQFNL